MQSDSLRRARLEVDGKKYIIDLLHCYKFQTVILEITSKCNLRCVFCTKSIPDNASIPGRDMEMSAEVFDQTLEFIKEAHPAFVAFVGIGEPTFRSDWQILFQRVREYCPTLTINSNFGRLYSEEELDSLLQLTMITISIESSDATMQKDLRRSVDLRNIVFNLLSLRKRARLKKMAMPRIQVNCTVSNQNVFQIRELASLCAELKVDCITLSSLYAFDGLNTDKVRSIESFSPDQLLLATQELKEVSKVLENSSTAVSIQPRLVQLVSGKKEEDSVAEGMTRICTQPWGTITIGADGQVFPCCVVQEAFANIQDGANVVMNGDAIVNLREKLLLGDLPPICRHCSNAPLGKREDLMKEVIISAVKSGRVPVELCV